MSAVYVVYLLPDAPFASVGTPKNSKNQPLLRSLFDPGKQTVTFIGLLLLLLLVSDCLLRSKNARNVVHWRFRLASLPLYSTRRGFRASRHSAPFSPRMTLAGAAPSARSAWPRRPFSVALVRCGQWAYCDKRASQLLLPLPCP